MGINIKLNNLLVSLVHESLNGHFLWLQKHINIYLSPLHVAIFDMHDGDMHVYFMLVSYILKLKGVGNL